MIARQRLGNSDLTPAIVKAAVKLRSDGLCAAALGTEREVTIDGVRYVAVVELHNHPVGGPMRPWGDHHGISMFRVLDDPPSDELPTDPSPHAVYVLGSRSRSRLQGVHPDLVRVVERAITVTPIDFTVVEGLRSKERQAELVKSGASQTLHSRHLTGHAVDLAPWEGGAIHWDWPRFRKLAPAVLEAARLENVAVTWGGNWTSFRDGPHFELPRSVYP